MYNTIISGKIKNIETIFSEKENSSTQVYSLISLNDNKNYKIKGIIKGFSKGGNIYLVKRNKYAKFYDVINKKTLDMMKFERIMFGVFGGICSIIPIFVIYNLFVYKMLFLSYIVNRGIHMLYPLVVLTFISIIFLVGLPSRKSIREAKNIINKSKNCDIKINKVYNKEKR
ncbi:hypothetical protein ACTOJ1_000562 [Shigella flexneri]